MSFGLSLGLPARYPTTWHYICIYPQYYWSGQDMTRTTHQSWVLVLSVSSLSGLAQKAENSARSPARQTDRAGNLRKFAPIFHVGHFLAAVRSILPLFWCMLTPCGCAHTLQKQDLFWCRRSTAEIIPGIMPTRRCCQPIFSQNILCKFTLPGLALPNKSMQRHVSKKNV